MKVEIKLYDVPAEIVERLQNDTELKALGAKILVYKNMPKKKLKPRRSEHDR